MLFFNFFADKLNIISSIKTFNPKVCEHVENFIINKDYSVNTEYTEQEQHKSGKQVI
jgi:hypothetical protein